MKERITIKHDVEENWNKAVNFIPLPGELIIYDGVIENGQYIQKPRFKVGDGVHKVLELPFVNIDSYSNTQYDESTSTLKL